MYFKICAMYETNMKRHDSTQNYGKVYLHLLEEVSIFQQRLSEIVQMIRGFWLTVSKFDGSTKFLKQIIAISQKIGEVEDMFKEMGLKHDDSPHFNYVYQLFKSIMLNEAA